MKDKGKSFLKNKKQLQVISISFLLILSLGFVVNQVVIDNFVSSRGSDLLSTHRELGSGNDDDGSQVNSKMQSAKTITIDNDKQAPLKTSYVVMNPINIQNDSDFQTHATQHGWVGNGSVVNPYVIENIMIDGTNLTNDNFLDNGLITINNTRAYFVIRNCLLQNFNYYLGAGILLQNATNGRIENCEIRYITGTYGAGIRTYNVSNIEVFNATIYNATAAAFDIQSYSQLVSISDSTIYNNGIGVQVGTSSNIIISNNRIFNTTYMDGIALLSATSVNVMSNQILNSHDSGIKVDGSNNTLISGNTISNSGSPASGGSPGILVRYASNNTIEYNFITNSSADGILVQSASNQLIRGNAIHANAFSGILVGMGALYATNPPSTWINITNNVITAHPDYGVEIFYAENITVMKNNFIQNALGQKAQFYEEYYPTPSLNMSQNYWDEWTSPDADFDGFVDIPYLGETYFGLDASLQDPKPVTTPHVIYIPSHFLLPPRLIYPNSSAGIVNGTIFVSWRPAFDSSYDPITYDLYISADNGSTWSSIAAGLVNTSYALDTTLHPDGNTYRLKVVATDGLGLIAENVSSTFAINNSGSAGGGGGGGVNHTLSMPEIQFPTVGSVINGTVTVSWNASVDSLGHVVYYQLYYSDDAGLSWYVLADNLTSTSYSWDTTFFPDGNQYTLMLVADDYHGLVQVYTLPGTFTINNSNHYLTGIAFIYPLGGESLNDTVLIEWTATSDSLGHPIWYSVYHSPNNGTDWNLIAGDLTNTSYLWNTTSVPDGNLNLLKVVAYDGYGLNVTAITPDVFTINNTQGGPGQAPSHTLSAPVFIRPQAGETLNGTVEIKWNASVDSLGHDVFYTLYYSSDNGTTWNLLIDNTTATSYSWNTTTVPNGTYLLKLLAFDLHGLSVEVDSAPFTIANVSGEDAGTTPTAPSTSSTQPVNTTAEANQTTTLPGPTVQTPFVSAPFIIGVLLLLAVSVSLRRSRKRP